MAGHRRPGRHALRRAAPVPMALLTMLMVVASASAALPGFSWPVQSHGNRGTEVRAIQSLLRGRGLAVPYDGFYTNATRAAVMTFQASRGLPQTGIVDAATWPRLITWVGPGSAREPVLTVQRLLNEKRGAGLTVTGSWNAATDAAVRSFERHVGLTVDGRVDGTTWRYLLAHFDLPRFSATTLCDYSVGNGPANWGTGAAIGQLEAAGAALYAAGYGRIAVGDVSLEHAGDIPLHVTHEQGLDVDVRPIRDGRDHCTSGTNYKLASYDRTATRRLVQVMRAAAPGHVKLIYFNDPVLIAEGHTTWYSGHDDHLHVRYCEAWHPLAAYRC